MSSEEIFITGIGQSDVGVRLPRGPLLLTIDAIREALADAGLSVSEIDGVSSYPGRAAQPPGYGAVGVPELIDAMRLNVRWYATGPELPSQFGAILAAAGAIRMGQARHVICFRTVYEASALSRPQEYPPAQGVDTVDGDMQWLLPYQAYSPANWTAQYAMRHVRRYGLRREQLAQIAINGHANAILNPRALVRQPLTLDQYMEARMISDPLCLYDCDRFTDGSTAFVVSVASACGDVKSSPVRIASMAYAAERHSWDQAEWSAAYSSGAELWRHTDYKPKDVHTAQLYDGFSFETICWLEGLGLCGVGEAGEFIEGGQRIARNGELPLNTFGGQLGAGRLHGFGFVHEAVTQLRGEGGQRQVPGDPRVAVASAGGGPLATAMLLAKD